MATPLTISVLTPLQCEILKRIAEGASRPEIAKERGTSAKTTEYHCAQIMLRLGLDNVADLTQWAIAMGIVQVKFKNETPEITLELLSKIHEARMAAQRANPFQPKDPNAPRFKKVLKNPEPPVVVDPAGEDAWSEEMTPAPKGTVLTAVAQAVLDRNVPAQEQKVVATPEVAVNVPAQELEPESSKWSEFNPNKGFEAMVPIAAPKVSDAIKMPQPPKPVMGIDISYNQNTMTFKPIPKPEPVVKKANRSSLNGANFQGEYVPPPKCPKCGSTHGKQWVCRLTTDAEKKDIPKKISMSTFKMTPEALKLIGAK